MNIQGKNNKRTIINIVIILMIIVTLAFIIKTYADVIVGGTTGQISDEKTIIRTAVAVSRGQSSNNKVEIASLTTELGRYASTEVASISSEIIQVTFNRTGNIYEIDVNKGPTFDIIEETLPYLPLGYTPVANTDLESGFVIQDESGNQFVWVEVPRTTTVYPTAGLEIKNFTSEEFDKIEADLHTYTSVYRNGTAHTDTWYSDAATGLIETEYNTLKKKMLKSVYKNGGFYVGRYETGIDYSQSARTDETKGAAATQTPVIKKNAYPYNYVTNSQAQELSESFATTGYETSLMFGVQWDLIMKYLETTGAAIQAELNTNSTTWGNYNVNTYTITSTNAKYSSDWGQTYSTAPTIHNSGERALVTTGASETFNKQNIYDLAGNVWEWTLESTDVGIYGYPCTVRSGWYGEEYAAAFRATQGTSLWDQSVGFRVALYKDEGTYVPDENNQPPYIPEGYTAIDGTMADGFVIADSLGNEYVWVEVPQTVAVYPTAGLSVTAFTEEEFDQIENDLHTYTSVYRNGTTSTDTWNSEQTTGLTQTEYNTKKKKMLKSIYVNGGFYVGRYETGTATARTSSGDALTTAEIKQNIYPYDWISISQAQELSESFATTGYETSLMFGVQWDLLMKYLETSGAATQVELLTDSTNIGNYNNSIYNITNTSAKYLDTANTSNWVSTPYNKTSAKSIYLTTGANINFYKQNISDLAGNAWEYTLEKGASSTTVVGRSGGTYWNGNDEKAQAAGRHSSISVTYQDRTIGFRTCLYKDEGTSTYDTPTYIPYGYAHVAGTDMDSGFVIEDESGNQYVWVEVPRTSTVYQTAGTGIALFTDSEFEKIESDLLIYTSVYRNGITATDTWYSIDLTGLSEGEYNIQKKKMLKSIYKNGGFYVGRYETGIDYSEGPRSAKTDPMTQTPVIKQNAYPYNFVRTAQAQELASSFETSGYETSLMFGVQWDLIMKYLETSGAATQAELNSDSKSWGNYSNSTYTITNTNAKYAYYKDDYSWNTGTIQKTTVDDNSLMLLTTGASDIFAKQSIYDLAGNCWERTLEYSSQTAYPCSVRGGWNASDGPASRRDSNAIDTGYVNGTFRVSLYKDEGIGITAAYIPEGYTQVSGTNVDNGQVVQDRSGNQFVWVKVPRTTTVYTTAGLNIESFTDDEYEAIEDDLQAYTSVYDVGGYSDEWSSQDATGLTEIEYNGLKKKMLKSVYINGGFYVGRYETGIATARTSASTTLGMPLIQQNKYPYNFVTQSQSLTLAQSFSAGGYESSLMFGLQWNLIMKHLELSGELTEAQLNADSSSWGNTKDSAYTITNSQAGYKVTVDEQVETGAWSTGAYGTKTAGTSVGLTTGASDTFKKQNIYDLAGNVWSMTLENNSTERPILIRGGSFNDNGAEYPASGSWTNGWSKTSTGHTVGFRVSLFKDEGVSLKRSYDASNIDGNRATVTSATTIKDLAGNYDGIIYGNPTFGEGYIALNQGSSSDAQYIDMGPMMDLGEVTVNCKFSVSEIVSGEVQDIVSNTQGGGFFLYIATNGKIAFGVRREDGTAYEAAYSTTIPVANTIYDVTGKYDGKYVYLYVNGVLEGTLETEGGNIKNPTGGEHVVIGADPHGTGVNTSTYLAKMKLYSAKIWTAPAYGKFTRDAIDTLTVTAGTYATWDGTKGVIDSSAYNTNQNSQYIRIDRYINGTYIDTPWIQRGKGTYSKSFFKDSGFNKIFIKLNGNQADGYIVIDLSTLTNGKTYRLEFDVTEYDYYKVTIENIRILE